MRLSTPVLCLLALVVPGMAHAETVKIGTVKVAAAGPTFVAAEKGFFAAEGLMPEFVFFEAPQPVAVAVVSGDLDFGQAAATAALYTFGGQGAIKIVAGIAREVPGFPLNAFVASNRAYEAGLTSYTALPGHTVAVGTIGSPGHYILGRLAEKYGFDLKSLQLQPLQSIPNIISAISGGQSDASITAVNGVLPAIQHGDMKLLGFAGDVLPWQVGTLIVSTKTAAERGDTIKRFLRAASKGAKLYHDAFTGPDEKRLDGPTAPEILAILSKYIGQPPEVVARGVSYNDSAMRLDVKDVLHQIAWYKSQGMVKGDFDPNAMIDMRYVVPLP